MTHLVHPSRLRARSASMLTALALVLAACGGGGDSNQPNPSDSTGSTGSTGQTSEQSARLTPPADLSSNPAPKATAVGDAIGDPVTGTLGSAGGTISFGADGPSIDVPAGALAADTTISIQEIAGTAPHGLGRAFRFGPAGTRFSSPVTIRFPLPEAPFESSFVEGVGVAYQDGDGFWQALAAVSVDAINGTVSAETTHFSDWTLFQQTEIRPASASVAVNKVLGLWVYQCTVEMDPVTLITPLLPECRAATGYGNWSVNGVVAGNASVGTTLPLMYGASYTAPAGKPSNNPVAVSVEVPLSGQRKGLLVANVRVTDDDECSFEDPCPAWNGTWGAEAKMPSAIGGYATAYTVTRARWVFDRKFEGIDHASMQPSKQIIYRSSDGSLWDDDPSNETRPRDQPLSLAAASANDGELVIDYSAATPRAWIVGSASWSNVPMLKDYYHDPKIVVEDFHAFVNSAEVHELDEDGTAFSGSTSHYDESTGITHSSHLRLTRE